MITIAEALAHIGQRVHPLAVEEIALEHGVGRRLARDLFSDVDSPPYNKSLMDGFAVRTADIDGVERQFSVVETIFAGKLPQRALKPGECSRIMTGAALPQGADAVVMVEHSHWVDVPDNTLVRFDLSQLAPGHHVMQQAEAMRVGERIFVAGHVVRPWDLGVLAEIGAGHLPVFRSPSVSVLATGDELVPCLEIPRPGQIRNSNGPMLLALAQRAGARVDYLGVARDDERELAEKIEQGLASDVLVLSGGVSEGLADLVPRTLTKLGVQQVFHKVSIKPGKPIWFGEKRVGESRRFVFGLPGNPVSTLVCFHIFVQACLDRLSGAEVLTRPRTAAWLDREHAVRGPRPTYWPARMLVSDAIQRMVSPLVWRGSSDLRALADSDALVFLPPRDEPYAKGEQVEVLSL